MSWYRDLPIKRTLTLVILATCAVVLILAGIVSAAFNLSDSRRALAREMTTLADILGQNSRAALAFRDEVEAGARLLALQSEPHVMVACLYDSVGGPFASYFRPDAAGGSCPTVEPGGHRFSSGSLLIFRPVMLNGKQIGTIHLQADLQAVYGRLRTSGAIGGLILLGSLAVAAALSSRLQRTISRPILGLAETARVIAERKDYSVRASERGRNEIGLLTDAFNQMLASLEERESALLRANAALESENTERKLAEDRVQAQLGRLELLNQITRAIGERLDLQSIFQVVIQSLEDLLPVDLCFVCLYDSADRSLAVTGVSSRSESLAAGLSLGALARIPIDSNGLARCVQGRWIHEPDTREVDFPFSRRLAEAGLLSLMAGPLVVESSVIGVLVAARRDAGSFSSGEGQFLRQLSEHVALAAHQAQLNSSLQRAYDDLRQTQEVVMQQERLRALGQMASGIAHDINNAISPVTLYTELLLESEPNLTSRAREALEVIQRAIGDVAETVGRMREFSRQREQQAALAPVQLNRLVPQVIDLTRARWSDMPQQRGAVIDLRTELAVDPPAVMGIESEIREALINLVLNAVDAMPEGGSLTLRTSAANGRTSGGGTSVPRHICLEVTDTGAGMDEATRARCLEPFFSTKGERGTGLGLAMVYGTMQRHRGEIEVESSPGRGTTVRLTFEVSSAAQAAEAVPGPNAPRRRVRALAVDDDPVVLKSLRDALVNDGHEVVVANSGQGGIDAFRAAREEGLPFAVVITDLGMPYVDGRKVAEAVKTASPSTPVILLTGWGESLQATGELPAHVDRVLSKPARLGELRAALADCCDAGAA